MSNLVKAILQSSLFAFLLIFIAFIMEGEISLPEFLISLISVEMLLIPHRYHYLSKISQDIIDNK